jgi:hypothetical protein
MADGQVAGSFIVLEGAELMKNLRSWLASVVVLPLIFVGGWLYGPDVVPHGIQLVRATVCPSTPGAPWLLAFSGVCAELGTDADSPEDGKFFWRSGSNRKALVFVHGVTGTATGTWTYSDGAHSASWPDIIKSDKRLQDYDIYVASYFTPQLNIGPTIAEIAQAVRKDLEKAQILPDAKDTSGKSRYEEVIFICHSMGNLVIRTMMILNPPPHDPVVRMPLIPSLASPSAGSVLVDLVAGSQNPTFKEMAKFETNSFLQLLNEVFKQASFDTEIACAYEEKAMPVLERKVVEMRSAIAVCTRDDARGFAEDHISIVKPSGIDHPVHKWAVEQIQRERKKAAWVLDRWVNNEIFVGGKDFPESNMHAAMIKLVLMADPKLSRQGLKVTMKYDMGHASRVFSSLVNRGIDIYPEYDGSLLYEYLRKPLPGDPTSAEMSKPLPRGNTEAVNLELQKGVQTLNMRYFNHFGFNDPYVLSFDWEILQIVQRLAPEIPVVYLSSGYREDDTLGIGKAEPSKWTGAFNVNNYGGSVPKAIKAARGVFWSPDSRGLDAAQVEEAHALGIGVPVWTVNDPGEMARVIDTGADGIITDYPDLLRQVLIEKGKPVGKPLPRASAGRMCEVRNVLGRGR